MMNTKKKKQDLWCGCRSDEVYILDGANKKVFGLCEDCYYKLFNQMFEQLLLEHRSQTFVNVMQQDQIDKLKKEVEAMKNGKR
jgi:hypothetical protein